MKNLIYQYWLGEMEPLAFEGKKAMEQYAQKIGCEYRFDKNPVFIANLTDCASHMSALRPVFDKEFHTYDKVMYIDCDIFPVKNLQENIFESNSGEIGICEELHQPKLRESIGRVPIEEKWASRVRKLYGGEMPKTKEGLYRVFNSGLVIYSKEGMKKAHEKFIPMQKFINDFRPHFNRPLYYRDQAYLPAMMVSCNMDWKVLDYGWNTQIHWAPNTKPDKHGMRPVCDYRDRETKFVHIQLSGSSNWGENQINQVINLPPNKWRLK